MSDTKALVTIVMAVAFAAAIALLVLLPKSRYTNGSTPIAPLPIDTDAEPAHRRKPPAITPRPFIDSATRTHRFRVLDIVSGSPVQGASLFADSDRSHACSMHPTDENGILEANLPVGSTLPQPIYVVMPEHLGGGTLAATLPKPPASDIAVPAYSRIIVDTKPPNIIGDGIKRPEVGDLWCASWPAVKDVLIDDPGPEEWSRLSQAHMHRRIRSYGSVHREALMALSDRSDPVEYHSYLKRIGGYNKSKVIAMHREIQPGYRGVFDMPYEGSVLVSFDIPELYAVDAIVSVVRGNIHTVSLGALDGRRIRLLIRSDIGIAVPDAHVAIVTRRHIASDSPLSGGAFIGFTPEGSSRRTTASRRFEISNEQGEVDIRMFGKGPGEVYVSATRAGHVGKGVELWGGIGIPDQDSYTITLDRVEEDRVLLTLNGVPLSNCGPIKITDLQPTSLLGQIDYPNLTSDSAGKVCLEQLIPGRRYAVIVKTEVDEHHGVFTWAPGMSIDLYQ